MKEEALKLADELDRIGCTDYCRIEEASPMIRKLVEELKMAEEGYELLHKIHFKKSPDGCIDPKSYFVGYEDGKVQQVNTPCEHEIVDARNKFVESGYMCIKCMSLFKGQHTTPQTKPLSDEEIDEILESLDLYIDTHAGVRLFARAIEAKVRGN
jgi:hypothetical protein